MAFIRVQKLKLDDAGKIISGSASIIDTTYVKGQKFHSSQRVRESLGKVVWLSEDRRKGIFLSATRGLVEYSADNDSFENVERGDSRLKGSDIFVPPAVHTIFGDVHWLLQFVENCGLGEVLRTAFPDKKIYSRVVCHMLHGVLRDGSRVTCDNFIAKSFASHVFRDIPLSTLRTDSRYFAAMGSDASRQAFFKAFVGAMRRARPDFGKACYVDSTPLPNDIADNPFNALCSHGVGSVSVQTRLALIVDEETGLPVWYNVFPGNVLDLSTIQTLAEDLEASIGVRITSMTLDAGYISRDLIESVGCGPQSRTLVGRMPAKKGFPHKDLYHHQVRPFISRGKYMFSRAGHLYFGKVVETEVFGKTLHAYVYVDKNNAARHLNRLMVESPDEFDEMRDCQKDWEAVRGGYFVLLSNLDMRPSEMLDEYFGRTDIESTFKTAKDYLRLMPLEKWSAEAVKGKILHDVINTIVMLELRRKIGPSGVSISDVVSRLQSLMCFRDTKGNIRVEVPNRQVKEYYKLVGLQVPPVVRLDKFCESMGMTSPSASTRRV